MALRFVPGIRERANLPYCEICKIYGEKEAMFCEECGIKIKSEQKKSVTYNPVRTSGTKSDDSYFMRKTKMRMMVNASRNLSGFFKK